MKASDFIVEKLVEEGVECAFGYQGGNIAHTIDSLGKSEKIEFVTTYNEQGAAFAACGYAMEAEKIGVAVASSGPGAINLISGIANAYYDSIPCLFITGNVSLWTMKQDENVRQNAFQENDIVSMVSTITKYAVTVKDPHDLRYCLEKALYLAKEGRPGPVLIDLPHNIQKAELDFKIEKSFQEPHEKMDIDDEVLCQIEEAFAKAHRPLVVVGGGISTRTAKTQLEELLSKWEIPVVSSLRGLDVLPHTHKCYVGFGGAYGNRCANYALQYADCILAIGVRWDERFLNSGDKKLFEDKKIFHVDVDKVELGRIILNEIQIKADAEDFLIRLNQANKKKLAYDNWNSIIDGWKNRYPSLDDKWSINKAIDAISSEQDNNTTYCLDIGINQMCTAQTLLLKKRQNCYTSAGHGAMGCSLPLAIGAAFANRSKQVICVVGDGALHMNIQELLMLKKNKLNVCVVLNNNNCLGMIRDFQTKAFECRYTATQIELEDIDYEKLANAYQLDYYKAENMNELETVIEKIHNQGSLFVELRYDNSINTIPEIGSDMFHQVPMIEESEMEKIHMEAMNA